MAGGMMIKIGKREYRWYSPRLPADAIRVALWKKFPKARKWIFVRQAETVLEDVKGVDKEPLFI